MSNIPGHIRYALEGFEEACTSSLRARNNGDITVELYDEINRTIAHLENKLREAAEPKTIPILVTLGCPSGSTDWGNQSWNFEITDRFTDSGRKITAEDSLELFKDLLSDFMNGQGA
tara:strand:+ start:983 stop:1333 length:351 start_codon:yes stop_codon:yes gene_type:complete